jgi:hypothetical protein
MTGKSQMLQQRAKSGAIPPRQKKPARTGTRSQTRHRNADPGSKKGLGGKAGRGTGGNQSLKRRRQKVLVDNTKSG